MLNPMETKSAKGRQRLAFDQFMLDLTQSDSMLDPEQAADGLLFSLVRAAEIRNRSLGKGEARDPIPQALSAYMVAALAIHFYAFRVIDMLEAGRRDDGSLLAVYVGDPQDPMYGTYSISESRIHNTIRVICPDISLTDLKNVCSILKDTCPLARICKDRNLVAVGNGVFHFAEKQLQPFCPDLVFLSKIRVNYQADAMDVPILDDGFGAWTVESWMQSINSDVESVRFLWQVLGMMVRPNVNWEKMVLLYSEEGNNGKGTFCSLVRNILGEGNHTSIKLSDFSKDFAMTELLHTQAVICDENDVGVYIDGAANLKAAITGDVISVNRKYKDPVSMRFRGMILQCINGMPKVRDKSKSFLRRLIFVKMDQNFEGKANPKIKGDYLRRQGVLEYVLKRILEMDLDEHSLQIPASSELVKADYREFNDPVCAFWNEFESTFVWNLLPYPFLYDLYKKWFDHTNPRGKIVSYRQFIQDLKGVVGTDGTWRYDEKNRAQRVGVKMNAAEQLIIQWDLVNWMNPAYKGNDWTVKVDFPKQDFYRGLVRD